MILEKRKGIQNETIYCGRFKTDCRAGAILDLYAFTDWVSEENQHVNFVAGNPCRNLLVAALSAAEISLDVKAGSFGNKFSGCAGSA